MVKRKLLGMLMATVMLLTAGIGSNINVQAAENDTNLDYVPASVIAFENFEQAELEIPTIEVPEIIYNAEGNGNEKEPAGGDV